MKNKDKPLIKKLTIIKDKAYLECEHPGNFGPVPPEYQNTELFTVDVIKGKKNGPKYN